MVITGASTGIGEATAVRFATQGWKVFAGVRTRADASKLRETKGVVPLLLDVTSESSVREAAEIVDSRLGSDGLDALVNNAGIGTFGPVEFLPLENHEAVFDVNYFGLIRVTQKFLPALRCRNPGRIINVGSIAGKVALPCYGPYTTSKHAVEALSDCMRAELGKSGIKVSLLQPGAVKTPIWDKAFGSIDKLMRTMPPEAAEMYGKDIMKMAELSEESALKGMAVEDVVDVIEAAMRSSNPKARYPCGKNVGKIIFFRNLLPDSVFDNMVRRMMNKTK
ncbi:hypothetical protein BSKO_08238 [Bryopsis sp. KO-2023]|nr:hypothetical protein BSKO_08238 [Bryopsis sp. KO-2023]